MSHRDFSLEHSAVLIFTLTICALLTGCLGATRLPVRDRGPAGEQLQKNDLDLSFLESTNLHRDEVVTKLTRVDTGCSDPNLFWGRWAESKWGYWWVVAAQTGAFGDAKRVWHVKNLLITFDENGAIQSKDLIVDDRVLWRKLHDHVSQEPAIEIAESEAVAVQGKARSMTLTSSGLEIVGKKGPFVVSPSKVARFSHLGSLDKRTNAGITCHTLHLSEKTPVGNKVTFCDSNERVLGVFRYLNREAPKDMQWE